jgi:PhnB protein
VGTASRGKTEVLAAFWVLWPHAAFFFTEATMATTLQPYLNFNGNTEEAMKFYAEALGAQLEIMRFGDSPKPTTPENKNRVMHSTLKTDSLLLMACDNPSGQPGVVGNNVHLSLNFTDQNEQQKTWDRLSKGAKITMPLGDQFFGRFGMLTDKFGVNWMLNLEPKR